MLVEFTLKNFRSFKSESTLCLEAEGLSSNKEKLLETTHGLFLLPSVAIFGANASGKTNILKAMSFVLWAMRNTDITNPTTDNKLLLPFELNDASAKQPVLMQVVLWDTKKECEYRYGFEIDRDRVISEWLHVRSKVTSKFTKKQIFIRQRQAFEFGTESKAELEDLAQRVNEQFLALPIFAQLNHQISRDLITLSQTLSVLDNALLGLAGLANAIDICNKDDSILGAVDEFITKADTGIKAINIEGDTIPLSEAPNDVQRALKSQGAGPEASVRSFQVQTEHKLRDGDKAASRYFNFLDHESTGSLKLFILITLLMRALKLGGTFLIDELESSLHPLLVQAIIDHLENPKVNKTGVQLVYTSHDTYILTRRVNLRRDQICFAEKNEHEESTLTRLSEFKTRNDYDIARNYLLGRFGAVPVLNLKANGPNAD